MSEQKELVPKLRFPEFRGGEGWKEKRLGNEGEFLSSLTGKTGGDFDVGEARFVTYMNVFSNTFVDPKALRLVDVKEGENQNSVAGGDVFFTISSETPEEVGMSSVLLEDLENCYLNSFCALYRFSKSNRPNPVFTGYLLRQPLVRDYFTKKAQGSTRFNLSKDAFRSLPFFVPSPAEQQKIAECLSSVDELMAAQARKVDALKTHKKGLMQQLFPREGDIAPRLRFPEFQGAGDWKILPLAALADKIMVGIASAATHAYRETGVPMLRNQNIKEGKIDDSSLLFIDPSYEVAHKGKRLKAGDVITVRTGYPGLSAVVTERYQNAQCFTSLITRPKKNVLDADYLCAFINSEIGKRFILGAEAGGAQKNVNAGALEALSVYLPELQEQRRIATCLSSLDTLITLESQKLEALKTHKKGLMQQLFPSPEEVAA